MTKMIELVRKNTQTVINVFQMVKKEEKKVHVFKLDMETICNNPNCPPRDENYNVWYEKYTVCI